MLDLSGIAGGSSNGRTADSDSSLKFLKKSINPGILRPTEQELPELSAAIGGYCRHIPVTVGKLEFAVTVIAAIGAAVGVGATAMMVMYPGYKELRGRIDAACTEAKAASGSQASRPSPEAISPFPYSAPEHQRTDAGCKR